MLWSANFVLDYQVTDTSTDCYAQTELLACRKYFVIKIIRQIKISQI